MRLGGGSIWEIALYEPLVPHFACQRELKKEQSKDHKTLEAFGSGQGLVRR